MRRGLGPALRVPAVLGTIVPVVLLPLAVINEMPVAHLRMILAHELAHVRRHDYLVNLLQLLIEAVLFFNPAVWWLSRQVRIEREACCDALAVVATGSGPDYVRSLAELWPPWSEGADCFEAYAIAQRRRRYFGSRQTIASPGTSAAGAVAVVQPAGNDSRRPRLSRRNVAAPGSWWRRRNNS